MNLPDEQIKPLLQKLLKDLLFDSHFHLEENGQEKLLVFRNHTNTRNAALFKAPTWGLVLQAVLHYALVAALSDRTDEGVANNRSLRMLILQQNKGGQ